ncbi:MAG: YceI family protein [Gammaproteobacteria bacterium]|jgi:polyisoprenoid-binding protein YceI
MNPSNRRGLRAVVLAATALCLISGPAVAEPTRYEIDPAHTVIAFMVEHIGFARVLGSFTEVQGNFVFDETAGMVSDIAVTVSTASVVSHDEDRDEHLVSDDFLDVREFPEMTFSAGEARRISDGGFEVAGELTLLGETRPLVLEATLNKSGDYPIGRNAYAIGVSARGVLRRSDFGMDYAVDNGWVGDEVEIIIEFEAQRQ